MARENYIIQMETRFLEYSKKEISMESDSSILQREENTSVILRMVNLMEKGNFIFQTRKYSTLNGEKINQTEKES